MWPGNWNEIPKIKITIAAINVMPHPPQVGVGGALVRGLIQNLGPRARDFDPE